MLKKTSEQLACSYQTSHTITTTGCKKEKNGKKLAQDNSLYVDFFAEAEDQLPKPTPIIDLACLFLFLYHFS
jgi:hypothetical protein